MEKGTFRPEIASIGIADLKGKLYRVNGQHTCWAISESGFEFTVCELTYRVGSIDDLRELYACFDRHAARTNAHIVNCTLIGADGFNELTASMISVLSTGYRHWKYPNTDTRNLDPEDLAWEMRTELPDLVRTVGLWLQDGWGEKKHLRRAPVVAAMFGTWEKFPRLSEEFWQSVADGVGIDSKTDPRLKLRNWLQSISLHRQSVYAAANVKPEAVFRVCIRMWRAWRMGTPVTLIKSGYTGDRDPIT